MKTLVIGVLLIGTVLGQGRASGTLRVTAQIQGSISVEFSADSSRETVTATGGSSASFTVPTFGGSFTPQSMTLAEGEKSFVISSPFAIRVNQANLASSSYTLKARLGAPDPGHLWTIDGIDIGRGEERTISVGDHYDQSQPHGLKVSGSQQLLTNFIRFLIVSN